MPQFPPRLVNRGPAGLLVKLHKEEPQQATQPEIPAAPINHIHPALSNLVVDIEAVAFDPDNARLHPDRNMESIKQSLQLYQQRSPLVVNRLTGRVEKGNGTLQAAKQLNWTKIAVIYVEDDPVTAAGYGLADNRTAELAKWDFAVVARLDALLLEANHASVGWSLDELEVLRAADWTPPVIDEGGQFGQDEAPTDPGLLFSFTPDQYSIVEQAINSLRTLLDDPQMDRNDCIVSLCANWLEEMK